MPTRKSVKPIPSKANLFCFRCQVKLGKILNRGTFCPVCRRKICKKCLASSSLSSSFCQASLSQQTLINYQHISQKSTFIPNDAQLDSGQLVREHFFTHTLTNTHKAHHISPEDNCLNNNSISLSDKNLSLKKSKNNSSIDAKDVNLNETDQSNHVQLIQQRKSNESDAQIDRPDDQQAPKKTQRKNAGLYIKRAVSSTADSLAARRYRANLRSNTREQEASCPKNMNKVLSISCQELTQQSSQPSHYPTTTRCTSEQNLNHRPDDNLNETSETFDKSASLPKFKSLNRLLSKLKRSHTVHNVDDIGKPSSLFNYPARSNSLKNQYGSNKSNTTLWRRSSAKTIAVGQQLYMKTLNLGKKSLFKRHSAQSIPIGICKLKGICSFCCKKITSESYSLNQTIGYSFNRIGQIETSPRRVFNETNSLADVQATNQQVVPIPPARKSNLVKSNSQKETNRKMPIKPERQFIVQRCVLEQSCSMGELNIKQLDQISDQDSGLQTNSLEGLDLKSNPRKNRATTLPKTSMPFGMPLDSEKRGTLKVRSHIEMNEDGTFYVQDSDWEMTSESDHWQKSDQFSSMSSTELNELSCEYFRLNTNLCKDKLLNELSREVIEMDKSDTLCSRNMKPKAKCLTRLINDVNGVKCGEICSNDAKNGECKAANDGSSERRNSSGEQVECTKSSEEDRVLNESQSNEAKEEQSNDTLMKLNAVDDQVGIKESKRDQNQLVEENRRRLDTFINLNNETTMRARTNSNKNIKLNRKTNCRPMHRASSVGENMNENDSISNRLFASAKNIKRSCSETKLHFQEDDVHSADDELEEDESFKFSIINTNRLTSADCKTNESSEFCDKSSNLASISCNKSSSYCLDTYSFKKEQQALKMPDQGVDFFSSDEQSIEHNQAITKQNLINESRVKSPMLDQSNETTEDEIKSYLDDKLEDNEEYIEQDSIEEEMLNNYSLYSDEQSSTDQPPLDFESNEFDSELVHHDRVLQQQRHHITSLENLFSLETIQEEQDEEDYSLKNQSIDQSSLRSNISQPTVESDKNVASEFNSFNHVANNVSNNRLSNDESNIEKSEAKALNNEPNDQARIDLERSELQNESTYSQISLTRSQDPEELINSIYKNVCLDDEESTSQDYKKFSTFRRDSSIEHDVKTTNCDSLDGDNFNSWSECTIDENVTIEDQQIVVIKNELNRSPEHNNNSKGSQTLTNSPPNQNKFNSPKLINSSKDRRQAIKPEICKRDSLVNKNLDQLDKSKKKINEILKMNIEPRSRISHAVPCSNADFYSNKSNLSKGELNESGVHMDQVDDIRKKSPEQELTSKMRSSVKSSHLYADGSSGVDSGPSSGENNRSESKPIESSNREIRGTSSNQLLKSKSMYNVDQTFKQNAITEHRLSSEEFKRRRRSYEVNLNLMEPENNNKLINLRKKSTNYLLNQSFNQLSDDDIKRIKQELIRRSEERLARFESSISSRSNSNVNSVDNSIIESIQNSSSKKDESMNQTMNCSMENSAEVGDKKMSMNQIRQFRVSSGSESDENVDKRISRKELNNKWRDTLKRNNSLDSINSIKSLNSIGSSTHDELANLKVISRTRIKNSINRMNYEDEYDYSTNDQYVLKDQLTSDGEQRLIDNLIHCRSMEEIGPINQVSIERSGLYSINKQQLINRRQAGRESNREEDNDYDELVENSYVEMSLMSNNGSANNHTYKVISEHENPYELESDSLNELQTKNPYISLRDDYLMREEYENLQNKDYLTQLNDGQENDYQNLKFRSTDHLTQYSNVSIQRRETFNQPHQLNQVKLPLKRSKSVPGNTLSSKYLKNNKATMDDKLSRNSRKNDALLFDQLDWQKKHLHQLHKQHWKYRLRNADDEITDYTSLFTLNQQNLNRPSLYELLVACEYKESNSEIHVFIKECRNFGNLADKFIKIYLLPDKQSKQRSGLQSETIGHVNNLIERKSFSICSPVINKKFVFKCEQLDASTNSRTIFISVWKNKKSLLEKNHCLGELFLKVTKNCVTGEPDKPSDTSYNQLITTNFKFDLEDSTSRLSFNWLCLDQSFYYSGELVFSLLYEPTKNELQCNVIECLNLMNRKRDFRTFNTFCRVELKRSNRSPDCVAANDVNAREIEDEIDLKAKNDTNNNSKVNEKQVRFSVDDTLDQEYIPSLSLIDSQKTMIVKNSICPKYNKLFIFKDVSPEQLKYIGLELTVWCQSLTPYCLAGVRLGDRKCAAATTMASELTPIERCTQAEQNVWQQVLDRTKAINNNSIDACLHLRPID